CGRKDCLHGSRPGPLRTAGGEGAELRGGAVLGNGAGRAVRGWGGEARGGAGGVGGVRGCGDSARPSSPALLPRGEKGALSAGSGPTASTLLPPWEKVPRRGG